MEAIEEFQPDRVASLARDIEQLRVAELVDYAAVATLKLGALRAAYLSFASSGSAVRRADFEAYRRERGRPLECFAAFETLRGRFPGSWPDWPAPWQKPTDEVLRQLRESHFGEIEFHEFLQWNAERQLEACCDIARALRLSIGLYLDTAIGVDAAGADTWMEQGLMLRGLSVGAPPDQFNPAGQDWGLTAYNPHGLAASRFEPFRRMLRSAMRHAGAVRLDHVLGLMRLFVIPHGLSATQGAYLRLPFADMLAVVAEESRRWDCIVIGEDLGTVPENFRATLSAWGVWSYLVMMFERNWDGSFRQPGEYPALRDRNIQHPRPADLRGLDERARSANQARHWRRSRRDRRRACTVRARRSNAALAAATGNAEPNFDDVVAFLAATPTRLVSIAVEDVLAMTDQVNVPGTVTEHPNWRRRWPVTLEELAGDQRLRRIAALLSRAGRGSMPEP